MMRLLIVADDLSGAADCAARAGICLDTVLALDHLPNNVCPEVLSFDANTRRLAPKRAAEKVADLVRRYASDDGVLLFKKIDSTLRGNIAIELAAALETHRSLHRNAGRTVAVMAPAFPALGRTTMNGFQMVHGQPLHQREMWRLHEMPGSSYIPEMLKNAGLECELLQLEIVRSAGHVLEDAMTMSSDEADVLVCDAETDADLQAIATASMKLGQRAIWVGSAGLAHHLSHAAKLGTARTAAKGPLPALSGPLLFVIGSLSRKSVEQVLTLTSSSEMVRLSIPPEVLLAGTESVRWQEYQGELNRTIEMNLDVVIGPRSELRLPMAERPYLSASLARMTASISGRIGGLIASGGETARTVLENWGVTELRLMGELEKGVPISVTENWTRQLSVITKAGDFGEPETLLNCRRFLHATDQSLIQKGDPPALPGWQ
jgi:4-hydroxythreonine-4-phosphate dehydrogenase